MVIDNARSAAARSSMCPSNWMRIGAATPTVRPSPMFSVPRTFSFGVTVRNEPASGTAWPSVPVARPPQV